MSSETVHAYVLVTILPSKEQEFADAIMSKGLILDSEVEKIDFVYGPFDFVVILTGSAYDVDRRILEMRKLPYVQSTETLIPFEMFNWDDISATALNQSSSLLKNKTHGVPSLELELTSNCVSPVVLYSTKGGNTRKVAVEIASELNCPCIEITKTSEPKNINLGDFDLVLIGTGIYQKCPNADMVHFIQSANLDGNKQFALFLTWYKLGDGDRIVFNKINEVLEVKGKKLVDGYFECLGDFTKGHPDAEDLKAARKWVSKISKKA